MLAIAPMMRLQCSAQTYNHNQCKAYFIHYLALLYLVRWQISYIILYFETCKCMITMHIYVCGHVREMRL
jgi:hypothetical protein